MSDIAAWTDDGRLFQADRPVMGNDRQVGGTVGFVVKNSQQQSRQAMGRVIY